MKKIKRALSLVLVFCMLCTMTVTGFAADTTSEGQTDFMKIVHLDAGRKYFSVDSIKKIIDNASADGYNYLELAVGNDGLRFLLDDMSVTVDGTKYASDTVTAGIQQGNKNYYDAGTNELTESEMDTIIAYANEKGISIIPLINSPGHMDAIIDCMESLGLSKVAYEGKNEKTSASTIDVANATAVAFTQALIQKYVDYFAGKGCKYFNMGADEYANDVDRAAGGWFAGLINAGGYENFVTYVNDMAKIIKNANMTPMAFNDGIYYKETSTKEPFDSQILISYWSNGWNQQQENGYAPASASYLTNEKGFKILNTNDAWYYVLGNGNSAYNLSHAQNGVQNTKYNDVPGDNDPTPVGSMICVWCDTPSASYSSTEEANIADLMKTFATSNPEVFTVSNSSDSSDSSITTPSKAPAASEVPSDALTSSSIKLEYWITNRQVTANNATYKTIKTSTDGITTEAGVDISSLAPSNGYNKEIGQTLYYWQTMRLDSSHKQTGGDKVDRTANGTTLTHIRNLNGAWQYQTSDGTWNYFQSDDQLVAYYLQKTDVTKEITTYAKDWGYSTSATTANTSNGEGQVALTVAVVYEDSTVSPTESKMYSSSTTIFNYWDDRDIGIVAPTNNSDYEISKITVTDGTRNNNKSANVWYINDSITWETTTNDAGSKWYDETTVWDESSGTTPMVNGAKGTSTEDGIIWSAKNTAKLVLIYLKPVQKETNLNVVYWDDTSNAQINKNNIQIVMSGENATYTNSLKNSSGQVIGTKTDWNSNDKSSSDYLPDDAYVTNSTGINQTINKDISLLTDVDAKYKTGLYQYQKAEISEDGKTLTLHYSFDNSKLAAQYVVDFGESVNVPIADIIDTSKVNSSIDKMEFAVTNGEAKVSRGTDNSITFTPTSIMQTPVIVTVKITFKDDKSTISPKIAFVPASNVMYEESFVKRGEDEENSSWKTTGKAAANLQEKEVLGNEGIHGYDESYAGDDNAEFSNGSAYQATLTLENGKEFVKTKDKATFTFTGTGFDLISECGTDTGIVSVVVKDANGNTVKAYLVDTYFTGDTDKIISGTGVLDYQVPIVRCTELKQGTYTVETRGYLTSGSGAVAKTAEETTEDEEVSEETVAEVLDDLNVKNVDASEVEATCMDDNSVLLGGTGAEETTTTKSKARAAAAKTTSTTANVYIDGVRVYNTLNDSNGAQNYTDSEKNVKYESVYDYVKNSLDANEDNAAVYVEYDGDQDVWNIADYKQQGPENEVYLTPGHSIAIALDGYNKGDTVQIAAKAINGEVSCDGLETTTLSTATEMYYTAVVNENEYVQITNNTGSKGVLALSEMKVSDNISAIADPELATTVLDKLNHKAEFVPETLTVSAPKTLVEGHLSTLSVKASASDVEDVYLFIDNGKAEKLKANNSKAVKRGKSKTYSYSVAINPKYTLKAGEEHTYSVYAVSKDGKQSDPVVATVTVTKAK